MIPPERPPAAIVARNPGSLDAAGLHIAPRFLGPPGEVEISFRGGSVGFPSTGGAVVGGQLGLQATIAENLVLLADLGPRGSLGLRGQWLATPRLQVGWDVRGRSDVHFQARPTQTGLSAPAFGLIPDFPGGAALGGEASIAAALRMGDFRLDLSPAVYSLSNREGVGLRTALEWRSLPWELGLGAVTDLDVGRPDLTQAVTPKLQWQAQLGLRHYPVGDFHWHGVVAYTPGAVYGTPSWSAMLGTGWRLFGQTPASADVTASAAPRLAPRPRQMVANPASVTPPERLAEPAELPPGQADRGLRGRVTNGLALGDTAWAELGLKRRVNDTWVDVPWTYHADAAGRFRMPDVPPGEYQVVYRGGGDHVLAAGAAVSDVVKLDADRAVEVDLDVGWDATQLEARRTGTTVSVRWPAKPDVVGARYEVVVKVPGLDRNVVSSGETTAFEVRFELPEAIARVPGLVYAVKYRAPGGTFKGANRYGQTLFRPLEGVMP